MHGKKILITGGAGFIGSHLAEELAKENRVTIIDDLSTGRLENIAHLLKDSSPNPVSLIEGSIIDLPLLQKFCGDIDFVFHQAAIASVTRSVEDPAAVHETNVTGTLNVLRAAHDNEVKKVVFASSCAVYGNDPALPKSENMAPLPESPYAVTKLAAEYYCRVFTRVYRLPTVCLRYFNVYGPRQDPHSEYAAVVPRFVTRALRGEPLLIYGDGGQTRDFVYVKDVVRANIMAAGASWEGLYNVGSGREVSVNMLAVTVKNITGSRVPTLYQEERPGEVRHSRADITRAAGEGYAPGFDLPDGLTECLAWYLSTMRAGGEQ